jgi:hypothetical protein
VRLNLASKPLISKLLKESAWILCLACSNSKLYPGLGDSDEVSGYGQRGKTKVNGHYIGAKVGINFNENYNLELEHAKHKIHADSIRFIPIAFNLGITQSNIRGYVTNRFKVIQATQIKVSSFHI